MKKVILVPALLGVMGIGGALAVYGEQLIGAANNETLLTSAAIEQKALAEVNGTIRDVDFEQDGSKRYYEVEVLTATAEYDLTFDAVTGELLQKKKDTLDFEDKNTVVSSTTTVSNAQNSTDTASNTPTNTITTNEQPVVTPAPAKKDTNDNSKSVSTVSVKVESKPESKASTANATAPRGPKNSMKEINDDRFDDDKGPGDDRNDKDDRNDDNDDNNSNNQDDNSDDQNDNDDRNDD